MLVVVGCSSTGSGEEIGFGSQAARDRGDDRRHDIDEDSDEDREPEQVEICHMPHGSEQPPRTIYVSERSVGAHLRHGDSRGPCESFGHDDAGRPPRGVTCGLTCGGETPTQCGDGCVDTETDRTHCGGCLGAGGESCGPGEICEVGVCVLSCGGDTPTLCDRSCVDTNTNPVHCGGCADIDGISCLSGEHCVEGQCELSCPSSTPTACGDVCVDTAEDRSHCGGCGVVCGAEEVCTDSTCQPCSGSASLRCGDTCIDPMTDTQHCGGCPGAGGSDCGADGVCLDGLCFGPRTVFATSLMVRGDFAAGSSDPISVADGICQSLAVAAGLTGRFKAWISSNSTDDPQSRFNRSGMPYHLVDGTVIAEDWSDLVDGNLAIGISLDENGGTGPQNTTGSCWPGKPLAFTGTQSDGTHTSAAGFAASTVDCNNWTVGASSSTHHARVGLYTTNAFWTQGCGANYCGLALPLLCFQD